MGITTLTLADGRVQLLYTFSNVKGNFLTYNMYMRTNYLRTMLKRFVFKIPFTGKNTARFGRRSAVHARNG